MLSDTTVYTNVTRFIQIYSVILKKRKGLLCVAVRGVAWVACSDRLGGSDFKRRCASVLCGVCLETLAARAFAKKIGHQFCKGGGFNYLAASKQQ